MSSGVVSKIRKDFGSPLILVAGSSSSKRPYERHMGMEIGHGLRDYIEHCGSGAVFTAGDTGIGIDVYAGCMKWCIDNKADGMPEDRFFVIVPKYDFDPGVFSDTLAADSGVARSDYVLSDGYAALGMLSPEGKIRVYIEGNDRRERRRHVAEAADALVVVSGGDRTFDEALQVLEKNKFVIALRYTGGIAATLAKGREMDIVIPGMEECGDCLRGIDRKHILVADSADQLVDHLNNLNLHRPAQLNLDNAP